MKIVDTSEKKIKVKEPSNFLSKGLVDWWRAVSVYPNIF
jgi:hypothetical protein